MNERFLGAFKGQYPDLLGPSRELSKMTISKLEQIISLQFASLREYTEMNLSQLRAAAEISSPEDFKEYLNRQQDFLKTVSEKLAGDAQAMATIGQEFTEEAQRLTVTKINDPKASK